MAKAQPAIKEPNAVVRYYRETVGELKKVVWPTREETLRLTGVVLLVITLTALVLGGFDYVFALLFQLLISLV
jgi:preprotein translocase subunit SecE